MQEIAIAVIGSLTTLALVWLRAYVKKKYAKDPVADDINMTVKVNEILEDLRVKLGADRAYIFQFHNGVAYYTGQHQQRFSCTYEKCGTGISSELRGLQNLIISAFSWFLASLATTCWANIEKVDECVDASTRDTLRTQGVKSCYNRMISDSSGKFIGFVGLDYVRTETKLNNKELEVIDDYSLILQGYLVK